MNFLHTANIFFSGSVSSRRWAALLLLVLGGICAHPVNAAASVHIPEVTAAPGSLVLLHLEYEAPVQRPSATLLIKVTFPTTALTLQEVSPGTTISAKNVDYEVSENRLSIALFGGAAPMVSGHLLTLALRVADDAQGTIVLTDAGSHGADAQAMSTAVTLVTGGITAAPEWQPHKADVNGDWRISLEELLRIIQLYAVGAYHCDANTADGYAPGAGELECGHHDADYAPADGRISFEEVLRIIQLYNAPHRAYHLDVSGEDGFAPGPFGFSVE